MASRSGSKPSVAPYCSARAASVVSALSAAAAVSRRLLSRFDLAAYTVTGETSPDATAPTTPSAGNREAVNA